MQSLWWSVVRSSSSSPSERRCSAISTDHLPLHSQPQPQQQPPEMMEKTTTTTTASGAHEPHRKEVETKHQPTPAYSYFFFAFLATAITLVLTLLITHHRSSTVSQSYHLIPLHDLHETIRDRDYAIVFDGGSTGTRVHIFSFLIKPELKQRKILLGEESYFYVKPGLSSYAANVSGAAWSLEPLLRAAGRHVPSLLAPQTPLILKATAGLRLLPGEVSQEILDSVQRRLEALPFKVATDAVSMLADQDEGLYAWYTVNFLLDRLHNISESIATLDLGGGSTQVTFSTADVNTLVMSPPGFITRQHIEGEPEYIYSHSYLGNGLMSAREAILLRYSRVVGEERGVFSSEHHHLEKVHYRVMSPCFRSLGNHSSTSWTSFNGHRFTIGYDRSVAAEEYGSDFAACYQAAQHLVDASAIDRPPELAQRAVYAMSYFYDRMKDIRVVREESGYVKVRDYFRYAEHLCGGTIRLKRQSPFLCLDLAYIAAYLYDGLGLPLHKDILLIKKFKGIEISWALGAAINLFDIH